jgi:hypothetical protein
MISIEKQIVNFLRSIRMEYPTMNIKLALGCLILLLTACNQNRNGVISQTGNQKQTTVDTIMGKKLMTNDVAGSLYLKRAVGYSVIVGKDTSDFTCIFSESKDGGKVEINLNISYTKITMTYRQRMDELAKILPLAVKDFNFDSLTTIDYGRLILSGDLAIDITNQYIQKFGKTEKITNYGIVSGFLKNSKLATDLDILFKPYSISVDNVSVEKVFFTTKQDLYRVSKIETDTTKVPDKILDCMTRVRLSKK